MYEPGLCIGGRLRLFGELIGPGAALLLDQMISVAGLQPVSQEPSGKKLSAPAAGKAPGDLKIEQVGAAVVADQHVFAFFEIDVGHATGVNRFDESAKLSVEIVGDVHFGRKRAAFDELADEAGLTPAADQSWDAGHAG